MIRTHTPTGDPAWLVTDYARVRDLLADERLGRSHPVPENASRVGESAIFGGPMGNFETELTDHARMRALLQPHFSPKYMRTLRPRVATMTTELLDQLESPADLHAGLALPLPIMVICELLGVPYEDREQFRAWSEAAGNFVDGAKSTEGLAALYAYGLDLIARKRVEPGDDVLSRLAAADEVTDADAAQLAMGLLFAGHETTVVQIGMGALNLLTRPEQWRALLADPVLIPGAVEEILRWPGNNVGLGGMVRYARTDFEVDGIAVQTGDLLLLSISKANLDASTFPEPEQFDITRPTNAHVTFGYGIRYCLGAPLARIELTEVLTQLIPRFPDMRLAVPESSLTYRTDVLTGGLIALPVTW
jgi:pentalenolactone synthase